MKNWNMTDFVIFTYMVSSYNVWVNLLLYCDYPRFSIVWDLVLYPLQETNWWFRIRPPEIVSIVDGSYALE